MGFGVGRLKEMQWEGCEEEWEERRRKERQK